MTHNPKAPVVRDQAYLDSYRYAACIVCGRQGQDDVVGAHLRWGSGAGIGRKPGDDLTLPLCARCHQEQHAIGEEQFWYARFFRLRIPVMMEALRAIARERYRKWKES